MPHRSSKKLLTVVDVSGMGGMTDEQIDALAEAMYEDMVAKMKAMSEDRDPGTEG